MTVTCTLLLAQMLGPDRPSCLAAYGLHDSIEQEACQMEYALL